METDLFAFRQTHNSGIGTFSLCSIPNDTVVLSLPAPYASVIMRKWRKEICAWCYLWRRRPIAAASSPMPHHISGTVKRDRLPGQWCCSRSCLTSWIREYELWEGEEASWVCEVLEGFEKAVLADSRRGKTKQGDVGPPANVLDYILKDIKEEVTPEFLDRVWREVVVDLGPRKTLHALPMLNEFELDTARFVLDGTIRKLIEEFRIGGEEELDTVIRSRRVPSLGDCKASNSGVWKDFILLQNNELDWIRSAPYMLGSSIKIYAFLKGMIGELYSNNKKKSKAMEMMFLELEGSQVFRCILGRDTGNTFGIWEEGRGEESEMFGWGAYIYGSFFNHDCVPNVMKRRMGRCTEFYTSREVKEGEELSISYNDDEDELRTGWFFSCTCERCTVRR